MVFTPDGRSIVAALARRRGRRLGRRVGRARRRAARPHDARRTPSPSAPTGRRSSRRRRTAPSGRSRCRRPDRASSRRDEADREGHEQRRDADAPADGGVPAGADRVTEAGHRRLPQQRRQRAGHPQQRPEVDAEQAGPTPGPGGARATGSETTVAGRLFITFAPATAAPNTAASPARPSISNNRSRCRAGAAAIANVPSARASSGRADGDRSPRQRARRQRRSRRGRRRRRPRPARRSAHRR